MAEQYKSILEKYNESLKPSRLPTAEEEAIEPVYPEEYLMGGSGKAVASGFRSSAEKAAAKAVQRERMGQIKIGSRVPNPEAVEADKAARNKFYKTRVGQEIYKYEKKQAEQVAKDKAINNIKNVAKQSSDRAKKNFSGEVGTNIGGAMADENRNAAGDTYKKGGKVSASSRADGIASRGKTRGRII